MLYRYFGITGSGTSTTALDRVVNANYDNVLIITNELPAENILKKLHNYQENTKKVIVNKINIEEVTNGSSDVQIDLLLEEAIGKYDCVLIDGLEGIGYSDNTYHTFYEDLCEKYTLFSRDNNIDIITTQYLNVKNIKKQAFDEAVEDFSKIDLPDDQELILTFRSTTENNTPFIKIYERRNNLIRSFNINHYFNQENEK